MLLTNGNPHEVRVGKRVCPPNKTTRLDTTEPDFWDDWMAVRDELMESGVEYEYEDG